MRRIRKASGPARISRNCHKADRALRARKDRDRSALSESAAQGRRLQPRHQLGSRTQHGAPAGRLGRHARVVPRIATQALAAAQPPALGVCTSRISTRRWSDAAHRQARPSAVELVDRTMIGLAREIAAFREDGETHSSRATPTRSCWSSLRATISAQVELKELVELMADLGFPGSVVEIGDAAAEEILGSAQGGPEHHDVDEGRRQTRLLHRGLRGAARAPRRVHRPPHAGVRKARHARHLVRACLGRHAARASGARHAPRRCAKKCAPSPKKPARW